MTYKHMAMLPVFSEVATFALPEILGLPKQQAGRQQARAAAALDDW